MLEVLREAQKTLSSSSMIELSIASAIARSAVNFGRL
jgi:hypothetical protein